MSVGLLTKMFRRKIHSKPAITHCYYPLFSGGIGDFLGGSLHLWRLCETKQIPFYVDFKHHPIGHYLKNQWASPFEYLPKEIISMDKFCGNDFTKMEKTIGEIVETCNQPLFVASIFFKGLHDCLHEIENKPNWQDKVTLSEKERTLFQKALVFSDEIENRYAKFLRDNQLTEKKYNLVHFRLGDRELLKNQGLTTDMLPFLDEFEISYQDCIDRAMTLRKTIGGPLVFLTDSNDLKQHIREKEIPHIILSPTKSSHSVSKPGLLNLSRHKLSLRDNPSFDVALDIRIIQGAQSTTSFSNHFWGSGFSFWTSRIFDVPITTFYLGKLLKRGKVSKPSILRRLVNYYR